MALVIALSLLSSADLRALGTKSYAAKRYEEACKLFERARVLSPNDAGILADLGLCQAKLGQREKAIAATLRAAELGDAKVRKHAYFNLWKLGRVLPKPPRREEDGQAACVTWPSDGACKETLHACSFLSISGGTGLTTYDFGFAISSELAAAQAYSIWSLYQQEPGTGPFCVGITALSREVNHCRAGDVGGAPCGACLCDNERCEAAVDACAKHAESEQALRCTVVFADACNERIGAVCNGKAVELGRGDDVWSEGATWSELVGQGDQPAH